jgi:hypothetical protein
VNRAVALLELARELAHLHHIGVRGRVNVVSVLIDDLTEALPVVEALVATTQGRLLQSMATELEGPVPGTRDPTRIAAIRAEFNLAGPGAKPVDLRTLPSGDLDVEFRGSPSAGLSHGERTVLAVARALGHRDLDDHELGVVAYRGDLVDLPFSEAIWRLGTTQFQGMPHGVLRTLVMLTQASEIRISLHCQSGRGFDFAVYGDRLLRRKRSDDLQAIVGEIAARTAPIVFFLGAGFSASSQMPIGNALRDASIRRVLATPALEVVTSDDLALRFHQLLEQRRWLTTSETALTRVQFANRLTLERVIQVEAETHPGLPTLQEFRELHDRLVHAPGAAVLDLAQILQAGANRIILAGVNFDRLVEENTTAPLEVFLSSTQFRHAAQYIRRYLRGDEVAIPYLKLHGCISDLTSCIVNTDQTELGLGLSKVRGLRAAVGSDRLWIYVGASLRDLDLRPVLLSEQFAPHLDELWVTPYAVESYDEFEQRRRAYWRKTPRTSLDERLVTETADAFFAALRHASVV